MKRSVPPPRGKNRKLHLPYLALPFFVIFNNFHSQKVKAKLKIKSAIKTNTLRSHSDGRFYSKLVTWRGPLGLRP